MEIPPDELYNSIINTGKQITDIKSQIKVTPAETPVIINKQLNLSGEPK